MRETPDAPPVDCPACGTPAPAVFAADVTCTACDAPLAAAAREAQGAITAVEAAIDAQPALPPRVRSGLKARLFDASRLLSAALAAGERADTVAADAAAVDAALDHALDAVDTLAPATAAEVSEAVEAGDAPVEAVEAGDAPTEPAESIEAVDAPAEAVVSSEAIEPPAASVERDAPDESAESVEAVDAPAESVEPPVDAAGIEPPADPVIVTPPDAAADAFGETPDAVPAAARAESTPADPAPPAFTTAARPAPPTLWQRLGPAFAEHFLFFLGGFLLLAGAVYFVSTAWTTMTGASQLMVIEGGILLFGAGLVGAGRLLNRDRTLDDLDAVLATAGAAAVPLAGLAVGRQWLTGWFTGLQGLLLWSVIGFAVVRWGMLRVGIRDRRVVGGLLFAALGALFGPLVPSWPVLLTAGAVTCAAVAAIRRDRWPVHVVAVVAAGASAGQLAIHTGAWGVLALPIVASGVVFSRHRALSHADDLIAVGLAIGAFAVALLTPNAALVCAAAGCVIAARAALHRERKGLLVAAFVLGLAAYVLLPAPIKAFVLALKAKAAAGLGYAGGRLPLAWYGVTCLPYVALCGWVARRLRDTPLARTARVWTLGIAGALCLLAFTTTDLRAPLLVLPLEGLLLLVLAFRVPSMRMAQAAPVLIAALPVLATLHFGWPVVAIPLGIAVVALMLRICLPRRGAMVQGVYESCACLIAGALGLAVVPAVWVEASVHWLDCLAPPLLVLAAWPIRPLRPFALLGLHRMVPALAGLTGLWTWPTAVVVALAGTLAIGAWRKDRHSPWIGWALLAVAILGGLYAVPGGLDLGLGLLGAAALGVALAWGTGHGPLAAVALLCFAGSAGGFAWLAELRLSRIFMVGALALSLGIMALGWLHRRREAVFARIGWAPSVMGISLALVAVLLYIGGDALALIKKRSLITLGVGLLVAMTSAPRLKRLAEAWSVVGVGAIWLVARGLVGVLPWSMPVATAAVLAAVLARAALRFAPTRLPVPAIVDSAWPLALFIALLDMAWTPAIQLLDAVPLLVLLTLTLTRRGVVAEGLSIAGLAMLVAGPILGALGALEWAPAALLLLGGVGAWARNRPHVPRGFSALFGVATAVWLVAFGPDLVRAVIDGRVQTGPIWVGCAWIALGVGGLFAGGRRGPVRSLLAAPLLWWAPIASLIDIGPMRAAPSIAAVALVLCVIARRRPRFIWSQLGAAAALTVGLWAHPLTLVTAVIATLTIAIAAWRWRERSEMEWLPWVIAAAGTVGVLWFNMGEPTPVGLIGVSCASGALLAAFTGRHPVTVWALASGAVVATLFMTGWGSLAGLGATVALAWRAWRTPDAAAREGATVFAALTAAAWALWLFGAVPLAGVAALAVVMVAALLGSHVATLTSLVVVATAMTLFARRIGWPGATAGLALIGLPALIWWRRQRRLALEFVVLGLAAASLIWIAWAHGTHFREAVLHDGLWSVAAVAALAAATKRSSWTLAGLIGAAVCLHTLDPLGVRHIISAGLLVAAFALHARRYSICRELQFAPLGWAAALAVLVGLADAPVWIVRPWAGAAIGAVALLAAWTGRQIWTVIGLAVAAMAFTGAITIQPGTALAATLCAVAFAVTARRTRGFVDEVLAWCTAPLAVTAILGWALQLFLSLPLLAWAAAAMAAASAVAMRAGRSRAAELAGTLLAAASGLSLVVLGTVGAPIGVAGFALIGAVAALLIGWGPWLSRRPEAVHGLGVLLLLLHFTLARTTPWLDGLAGHHGEIWAGIAAAVAVVRGLLPAAVREALTPWLLGIPAIALFTAPGAAGVARVAFLGALTVGLASRGGPRWMRYAAFGLANLGAWAFWLDLDLVDPTLYGLPPGLTLLALAEVERARLSARGHVLLLGLGFALAYGGMAVQIVTVGGALHAALLLVGGLASVGIGWRLKRTDLLVGGTAAVVLDVVCYLLRHGFQQNFLSAGLLLFAGVTVLLAATAAAKMRRAA